MAHVLIGFADALPAPEVVFSLHAAGHRVSAFGRTERLPLARILSGELHVIAAPEDDVSAAKEALAGLMTGPGAPDVILPMDDTGLWLVDAALADKSKIAGATGEQAKTALNKAIQCSAARDAGLNVPPTSVIEVDAGPRPDIQLPVIVKPALAVREVDGKLGKGDAVYLADFDAVAAIAGQTVQPSEPLLAQPLIAGTGEGVFGFATDMGVKSWSGHRRLRMMNPHGSGSSACISFQPDAELCAAIQRFLDAIGWRGAFMVELLRDAEDTAWFMELNGRMWGSMALARRQGLEYPAWAVAQQLGQGLPQTWPEAGRAPLVMRHLGREVLHLLFTLRGPKSSFHKAEWPSFWRSLVAVLRPHHLRSFYNYDPAAKGYFLRDAVWTVKKALRR